VSSDATFNMAQSLTTVSEYGVAFIYPPQPCGLFQGRLRAPSRSTRAPIGELQPKPWVLEDLEVPIRQRNCQASTSRRATVKSEGARADIDAADGVLRSANLGLLRFVMGMSSRVQLLISSSPGDIAV